MICADQRCEASALSASPFSSVSARACLPSDCFVHRLKHPPSIRLIINCHEILHPFPLPYPVPAADGSWRVYTHAAAANLSRKPGDPARTYARTGDAAAVHTPCYLRRPHGHAFRFARNPRVPPPTSAISATPFTTPNAPYPRSSAPRDPARYRCTLPGIVGGPGQSKPHHRSHHN